MAVMHNPGKLITAFITLFLGVVLLNTTADIVQEVATYDGNISNEVFDVNVTSNATNGNGVDLTTPYELAQSGLMGSTKPGIIENVFYNNGTVIHVATLNTDYNYSGNEGIITLKNTTFWLNASAGNHTAEFFSVNYTYALAGYLESSWGRTAASNVPGFFAIALLLVSVALFFSYYNEVRGKN